jgi:hypothetical protein
MKMVQCAVSLQPPPSWKGYDPKPGAPSEDNIDNPASWSMFTFTPNYDKKNNYLFHSSTTGAKVVPLNDDGKRQASGWDFHYNTWTADDRAAATYSRNGATRLDLKPASRMGCLDVDVLKKHGLTSTRMKNDPMFFYQLLFPFCNPTESGIADDHRMPYFSNTVGFTNMYAYWKGAGSGYGHEFPPVSIPEMVHWTGVPVRNGALDGKQSTLQYRWDKTDPRYDSVTYDSIAHQQWREIKRYFKLSVGILETPKGSHGYDPCQKYDYIWRCLIHNMNYITAKADLDCTVDETTWGFSGYSGDAGGRLMNKPVSKGKYLSDAPNMSISVLVNLIRLCGRWSNNHIN